VIATVKFQFKVPVPSSILVANLLGILGLIGLTVAVGALAGSWWWSVLTGSVIMIGLSMVAASHISTVQADRPAAAPTPMARAA
jgi:amino acid transporter